MMTKGALGTRERILDEAALLIKTRGFRGMTVNDLLAAAGIHKGSLYFHFASKHEIGLRVLERARVEFREFLRASLVGRTPRARLRSFFRAALAKHRQTDFVGGCIWGNMAVEMSDSNEDYASVVRCVFDEWMSAIETEIAAGQDAGQFRADLSARLLAGHVIAAIEGGIMQSRLRKSERPLKGALNAIDALLTAPTPKKRKGA
jgi:TetR/AcrR family transcriptional regulator, transcriptional repressor for nem operon